MLINVAEASNNIRWTGLLKDTKMIVLSGTAGGLKNRPYYLLTIPSSLPLSRLRERRDYEAACAHPGMRSDKNISFDAFVVTPPSFTSPSPLRDEGHAEDRSYVIFDSRVHLLSPLPSAPPVSHQPFSSRIRSFTFGNPLITLTKWHLRFWYDNKAVSYYTLIFLSYPFIQPSFSPHMSSLFWIIENLNSFTSMLLILPQYTHGKKISCSSKNLCVVAKFQL